MSLETGTTISILDSSWPTISDPVSQGDDHLKLIKAVLKAQFPGSGGTGFNTPILATEEQLNQLASAGSIFPSGTKMPFYQASPPTGWSLTAIQNDSMMRVVSAAGTGGTSGVGANHSPILNSVVASHTHTFTGTAHDHAITTTTHSHTNGMVDSGYGIGFTGLGTLASIWVPSTSGDIKNTSSTIVLADNATAVATGTNAANTGAANWQPRYMDFCVGTKV